MKNFYRVLSTAVLFLVFQVTVTQSLGQDACETAVTRLQERGIRFDDDTFLRYVKAGNIKIVELFLQAGIYQKAADPTGATALVIATQAEKFEVARLLLAKGADPTLLLNELKKAKNIELKQAGEFLSKLVVPLIAPFIAALIGALFAWEYRRRQLKQQEIQLKQQEIDTLTGLVPHVACEEERAGALVILAELANPQIASSLARLYPSEGSALALISLVNNGKIKLNENKPLFNQVFIDSARNGKKEALTELLSFASDQEDLKKSLIEANDGEGRTALMWAARKNLAEAVEDLLESGSDACVEDKKEKTALHLAAQHGAKKTVLKLLEYIPKCKIKEIIESKDYKERTAKDLAERNGHKDILEALEEELSKAPNKSLETDA